MNAVRIMTDPERAFAELHHDLVHNFLRSKRLSEHDYYDVVIFGFIVAVQKYLAGHTGSLAFRAVAYRCMKDALSDERRYASRQQRAGTPLSLDVEIAGTDGAMLSDVIADQRHDTAAQAEALTQIARVESIATEREQQIFPYITGDVPTREMAAALHVTMSAIWGRAYRFRRRARVAL